MMLRNPLKSLTWNSLWRRSGGRLRRKPRMAPGICFAAEVLEDRQLLSAANVNLAVAGAITLSASDGGNHNVSVHRVDTTNVEFDPGLGTQITYLGVAHTSAFDVAAPFVTGVTVNLGTGYDSYQIYNLSTFGNITFNGNVAGEVGDDLEVYSEAATMNVGSVIFNVGTQTGAGAPLAGATPAVSDGGSESFQEVFTDGVGNLTVNGVIQVSESGAAFDETDVFTDDSGNLQVNGSVLINQSGTGAKENFINTDASGNLTILGLASFTQSGSGFHENEVFTDDSGNVSVFGVSVSESGNGEHEAFIFTDDTGNVTVGAGGFTVVDSGSGFHDNEVTSEWTGSVLINGNISIFDNGTGDSKFELEAEEIDSDVTGGSVTVNGSVYYSNALNKTGSDTVDITSSTDEESGVVTIHGALTVLLANNSAAVNEVDLGGDFDESSTQVTVWGPVLIVGGSGNDGIFISSAVFKSTVTINTGTSNPSGEEGFDEIEVAGSQFNGLVSVTMLGANAEIDVNSAHHDDIGFPPTVFNAPVLVTMNGPGAQIYLSNTDDGGTPVVFNSTLMVTGGVGGFPAGTVFLEGPVHFAFTPLLINFSELS